MKKSLRGLLFLMMMLFLPKTAAAEELKLPALPVKIAEFRSSGGKIFYQISYDPMGLLNERLKYVKSFQKMTHSTDGQNDSRVRNVKKQPSGRCIEFPQETAELHQGDGLTLIHNGYLNLKLTITGSQVRDGRTYWDFNWEILNKEGERIEEPVQFTRDRATAQIRSFKNLSAEDQEKWITRLYAKTDYQDVYAVYHKAISRNGASDIQRPLFKLLDETENLLTDEDVVWLERQIEITEYPRQVKGTEEKIFAAAAKTIPNLDVKIEEPKTDEALPTAATITPDGVTMLELLWTANGEKHEGDAKEDTAYTAQCRIKLADGKRLIPGKSKITVNDQEAKVEPGGTDGEYLVTYPFPKTETLQKEYKVTWDKNGGTGVMESTTVTDGKLTLRECTFTPPEGKVFDAWLIDDKRHSVGEEISITGDLTIYAQWRDKPPVPDKDTPTDSDTDPRVPEYRAPQAPTVRMRASDGSGTFVEGPAEALRNVHELVVERRSLSRWELSLRDFSGREVYSDRLMLVTVPVESFGTENLRLLVDGVYTSFSVSEDGKSVTFPAYFTKDGKRPVEDLLLASDDIEVHGNRSVLPEEGCRFVIEKKSAAKFEVNLVNARGETVHTTGPVWISFPAPDGNATHLRVKIDGRETTFEVENGRVRVAEMI